VTRLSRRRKAVAGVLVAAAVAVVPAADAPPREGAAAAAGLSERLASARPDEVIDVPPGEYQGPFVIARPVHLRGHGRVVLRGDRQTHVVAVRAPDVVIEGFEIRESGMDLTKDHAAVYVTGPRAVIRGNRIVESLHGVYVRQADQVRIENNVITGKSHVLEPVNPFTSGPTPSGAEMCEVTVTQDRRGNGVHLWNSSGHVVASNVIRDTRDGIYFSFVDRSDVRGNDIARVRYGLHYMYSDSNSFEGNVFRDNAAGAALMYSKRITLRANEFAASQNHRAFGLLMHSVDETDVRANRIAGNTMGLFIENSQSNRFLDNLVAQNHIGLHVSNSSDGNVFAGNTFTGNLHPVETSGTSRSNRWALDGRGNYWDAAMRLDLDGDGVADLPHRELDLFGDLRRPFPAIALLAGSPAERLLRFVHARLAIAGLSSIADPAPLVRPGRRP
jgi:nitrous oxidase accessory protein